MENALQESSSNPSAGSRLRRAPRRPEGASLQLVSRISAILHALENQPVGLSLGQIAKATGLPRATVHRIVDALEVEQFVAADTLYGGVRLGPAVTRLAASAFADFKSSVRPYLEALCRRVQETVVLSTLRHGRLTLVDQVPPERPLHVVISPSVELNPCYTAGGKAQLAVLPDSEIVRIIRPWLKPTTPNAVGTVSEFMAQIEEIRRSGVAYDDEEVAEGACGAAVDVRDTSGVVYCVSVCVPSVRYHRHVGEIREALLVTREQIENHCGARSPREAPAAAQSRRA
jgi:DNA-binding IclR family transcriptional regulator